MNSINIDPADGCVAVANSVLPARIDGELEVKVRSIDELPAEERDRLLAIKPTRAVRVIPATGWFRKF